MSRCNSYVQLLITLIIAGFFTAGSVSCSSKQKETKNWKTYQDKKPGFKIRYPADVLKVSREGEKVILIHSIPFEHVNPCDFVGDAPPLQELTDFKVTLETINKSLKETYAMHEGDSMMLSYLSDDTLRIEPGFIDKVNIGKLNGYRITTGVEGCGMYTYYFPLDSSSTLRVQRSFITELNPIIKNYKEYLKLPGIIPPDEEEKLFNQIVSSFKFLK